MNWRAATKWTAVVSIFIAVGVILYLYPVPRTPSPNNPASPSDLLTAVVPGIFSALLAILYIDMADIQHKQSELQDTQTELDRAAREPHLCVKNIDANGDIVEFHLENIGEGLAERLSVIAHLYIQRLGGESIALGEPEYQNQLTRTNSGSLIRSIKSGGSGQYSTEIYLPSREYECLDEKFRSVLSKIERNSSPVIGDVYLQFEIQYDHRMPDRGRGKQFLRPMKITLSNGLRVEDILSADTSVPDEVQSILSSEETTLSAPKTTYDEEENPTE